jgi:predicted nucleic acid-binding protein
VIVVDASVVVTALADDGPDGDQLRERLTGEALAAPHLLDVEVMSTFRRLAAVGQLDDRRVDLAVGDLRSLRIRRVPHGPLLTRCWQLRDSLTVYDAAYVALAEGLRAPLLTADRKLARASGPECEIEVVSPG